MNTSLVQIRLEPTQPLTDHGTNTYTHHAAIAIRSGEKFTSTVQTGGYPGTTLPMLCVAQRLANMPSASRVTICPWRTTTDPPGKYGHQTYRHLADIHNLLFPSHQPSRPRSTLCPLACELKGWWPERGVQPDDEVSLHVRSSSVRPMVTIWTFSVYIRRFPPGANGTLVVGRNCGPYPGSDYLTGQPVLHFTYLTNTRLDSETLAVLLNCCVLTMPALARLGQ